MRIEAQSRYLQSILEKAEAAFAYQSTATAELKTVRAELADLVSNVTNECEIAPYGAFPLLSAPPVLSRQFEMVCTSGGGDDNVLADRQAKTAENQSYSVSFSQNSTSGRSNEGSFRNGRLQSQLRDGMPVFWSSEEGGFKGVGNNCNADESQGSSTRTMEIPSNMCTVPQSKPTWKDISHNCPK
ncbi:hypothetical protein L7F22_065026 [Adiantum nelumboides]|nr:hypothetical protein [Adiantum nelumboides]